MHNFVKHGFMHNLIFYIEKHNGQRFYAQLLEGPGFMHNYCKFSRSNILVYVNSDRCVEGSKSDNSPTEDKKIKFISNSNHLTKITKI